jgi:hypothetical protein
MWMPGMDFSMQQQLKQEGKQSSRFLCVNSVEPSACGVLNSVLIMWICSSFTEGSIIIIFLFACLLLIFLSFCLPSPFVVSLLWKIVVYVLQGLDEFQGAVEDCCCDYVTVDALNQEFLHDILKKIAKTPFFRYFKVLTIHYLSFLDMFQCTTCVCGWVL